MERLVGHVAPSHQGEDTLSIFSKAGEEPEALALELDAIEAEGPLRLGAATVETTASTGDEEEVSSAERLETSDDPLAEAGEETEAAEDPSREAASGQDDEESFSEEDEPFSEEDEDDDGRYFEGASVQRDEPFPVEIQTADADLEDEDGHLGVDESEQIEPAAADASDPAALVESLTASSAEDLPAGADDAMAAAAAILDAETDTAEELARAIFERNRATATETEPASGPLAQSLPQGECEPAQDGTTAGADSTEPIAAKSASEAQSEPAAQSKAVESTAAKKMTPPAKPTGPTAKESRPSSRGFALRPVRTWDPTKGRGRRRAGGRSTAASSESLSQLAEGVGSRVRPAGATRREDGRKPVMVCFLPVQGGNGASTVSLHVAEAISHHLNERVLLADFDFHSGTLAFRLGLKPAHTLGDVFESNQNNDQLWDSVVCRWKKLDVLVAPPSNSAIHPLGLDRLPDIFGSALDRYPYVIVDHPDAIYSSSRYILTMSDLVYLVCTPEITSLHLARRKVQQIRAMGVASERLRLIVNRAGSWGSLGVGDVGKIVGVPVSWALNNDYAALRDAVWNGGLVQDGSELARQLRELGWSVMGVDAPVVAESATPSEVASTVG